MNDLSQAVLFSFAMRKNWTVGVSGRETKAGTAQAWTIWFGGRHCRRQAGQIILTACGPCSPPALPVYSSERLPK